MPEDVGLTRLTGVCGLDAPVKPLRMGNMASRETDESDIGFNAED